MFKTLYLARHAKSSWGDMLLLDFDRPLNKRGFRDAPKMAQILHQANIQPNIIVTSPANRAKTTAEFYHQKIGGELVFDERIYEASTQSLRYLAMEYLEQYDSVMVVGHNPGLTELNNLISDTPIYNLPTASIVGIELTDDLQNGKQILYEYPKKHR